MHGLDQSNALTVAAQKLSEAKEAFMHAEANLNLSPFYAPYSREKAKERVDTARHELGVAKTVYRAAYKAYTNPFGVEKTFS